MLKIVTATVFLLFAACAFAIAPDPSSNNPYEILGVDPLVGDDNLTDAWKKLAIAVHPDSGGELSVAQTINEAYQFLKKNRAYYDAGLLAFNGEFKKSDTRPVPLSVGDEVRFQRLYQTYLQNERPARQMLPEDVGNKPVFMLYAVLHLSGEKFERREYRAYELRAYRELLTHLGLLHLTRSELNGILLNDPIEALEILLEHYDNFNVRLSTLNELFMAYNYLFLTSYDRTDILLNLLERMHNNGTLGDRRFEAIKNLALDSLLNWLAAYQDARRSIRKQYKPQYKRVRRLTYSLVKLPRRMLICMRLLVGRNP